MIVVSGTVYQNDGKTPAKDIILYVYHTDQEGHYPTQGGETGWGRRHGYLRTWLKTNALGQYKFYTLRPASYPNSRIPAHIHATIKEPGKSPYWIDDYVFDDDPFLTPEERRSLRGRGGDHGVLKNGGTSDGITSYSRDIVLGLNVEGWR
jgi:protocatechuate 3,4-dioxygenase beta subunit